MAIINPGNQTISYNDVYNFWTSKGATPQGAEAMASIAGFESNGNTNIQGGAGNQYFGLYQWNTTKEGGNRWGQLQTWASNRGLDPLNPYTQLEFAYYEMTHSYKNDWAMMTDPTKSESEIGNKIIKNGGFLATDTAHQNYDAYYASGKNRYASGKPSSGNTVKASYSPTNKGEGANSEANRTPGIKPDPTIQVEGDVYLEPTTTFDVISEPMPNALNDFTSYTYAFTLSALTKENYNNPEGSYMNGDPGIVICSTASRFLDKRLNLKDANGADLGAFEFYIDDVVFRELITYNHETKDSNKFDITFKVYEPYSMGLLYQAMKIATDLTNNDGISNTPYLLTIDFYGWVVDQDAINNVGDVNQIPYTTRYLPLSLTSCDMEMEHGMGTVYTISGVTVDHTFHFNTNHLLKTPVSIFGKTVREVLQSGENSLQKVVNRCLEEYNADHPKEVIDEFVVYFPIPKEGNSKPSQNPHMTKKKADDYVQDEETVNNIGKSEFEFDDKTGGTTEYGVPSPKVNIRTFRFDGVITAAVRNVVMACKYIKDSIKDESNPNIIVPWFTTGLKLKNSSDNKGNGRSGRIFILYVHEYKISRNKLGTPGGDEKDKYPYDRGSVHKEYNYYYTGKNLDVLDLKLKFNMTFFWAQQRSYHGNETPDTRKDVLEQHHSTSDVEDTGVRNQTGETKTKGVMPAEQKYQGQTQSEADNRGGGPHDKPEVLIAKELWRNLTSGTPDNIQMDITIIGDPYYISNDCKGNYLSVIDPKKIIVSPADKSMIFRAGDVLIQINFNNPVDYDDEHDMLMKFRAGGDSQRVEYFSGLYQIYSATHNFSKGQYTTVLTGIRSRKQLEQSQYGYASPSEKGSVGANSQGGVQEQPAGSTPPSGGGGGGGGGSGGGGGEKQGTVVKKEDPKPPGVPGQSPWKPNSGQSSSSSGSGSGGSNSPSNSNSTGSQNKSGTGTPDPNSKASPPAGQQTPTGSSGAPTQQNNPKVDSKPANAAQPSASDQLKKQTGDYNRDQKRTDEEGYNNRIDREARNAPASSRPPPPGPFDAMGKKLDEWFK